MNHIHIKQGQKIALAGGCFWCTEAVFKQLKGVIEVVSGYTGGHTFNPKYTDVCTGVTGHAEAILITYDPALISVTDLLNVFFATHDPTTLNAQGADHGTQYRSAIFYTDNTQKEVAKKITESIDGAVTEIVPLTDFYPAENEHQEYYERNKNKRYCELVINPKLEKFQKEFNNLLKQN